MSNSGIFDLKRPFCLLASLLYCFIALSPFNAYAEKQIQMLTFGNMPPFVIPEDNTGINQKVTEFVLKKAIPDAKIEWIHVPVERWSQAVSNPEDKRCAVVGWRFPDSNEKGKFRLYSKSLVSFAPYVAVGNFKDGVHEVSAFEMGKHLKKSPKKLRVGMVRRIYMDLQPALDKMETELKDQFVITKITPSEGHLNVERMLRAGRIDVGIGYADEVLWAEQKLKGKDGLLEERRVCAV